MKNLYRLRFHRIAAIRLKLENSALIAEIKIAGWRKEIDLFKKKSISKDQGINRTKEPGISNKGVPFKKVLGVLESFKVNKYAVSIDTGDMQLNGILFPVFYLISVKIRKNIGINFIGENKIILEIENNLARMSWAFISS